MTPPLTPAIIARIQAVETGVLPEPVLESEAPTPRALADRMAFYQVPGVSLAVIHQGQLEWARGYGVRKHGDTDAVTPTTLFQAASISKPVAATAVLRLVSEGRLALDEDVNTYLRSWQIPANGPWQPRITLRHLLSHSGGLTVHGFPGYRQEAALPSLLQVLDGLHPTNTPPIRVNTLPGMQFRYAGGGYCVLQQLLCDVTGQPFPVLMRELVLDPLGMTHSTYEQPLPEPYWADAARGHRTGGAVVAGEWHVYPEMAAAGLWTTAGDLARFAVHLQQARAGQAGTVLTQAVVDEMLAPQAEEYSGLGLFLDGQVAPRRFHHGGDNEGFKCQLLAFADLGLGAAVMSNGDLGGLLTTEVVRAVARVYGWPRSDEYRWESFLPPLRLPIAVDPVRLARYAGRYALRPTYEVRVAQHGDRLFLEAPAQPAIELYAASEHEYWARVVNMRVVFVEDDEQRVTAVHVQQNQGNLVAKKVD